jgi:hypothetical protein
MRRLKVSETLIGVIAEAKQTAKNLVAELEALYGPTTAMPAVLIVAKLDAAERLIGGKS